MRRTVINGSSGARYTHNRAGQMVCGHVCIRFRDHAEGRIGFKHYGLGIRDLRYPLFAQGRADLRPGKPFGKDRIIKILAL